MSYKVIISPEAKEDIAKLKKNEPQAYKKVITLIHELAIHPTLGTGHPKQLSQDKAGKWSRRITQKHRLVYEIHEEAVYVFVLSSYGHYDDK